MLLSFQLGTCYCRSQTSKEAAFGMGISYFCVLMNTLAERIHRCRIADKAGRIR